MTTLAQMIPAGLAALTATLRHTRILLTASWAAPTEANGAAARELNAMADCHQATEPSLAAALRAAARRQMD